ncbi:fungal-specific transcription factor domain-containing protein [Aspergillus cavernicola]|uniref:Fungal-specific transcription factor domain-containing protein n=1 Tax=Aspergillus cavernicola TaxID=176166 RepID=A0ABR4IAW1_9EURO
MPTNTNDSPSARPYRSHKIPACDFCRKRRSRCTQETAGQPCLLCRMHGATCSRASNRPTASAKRRRISDNNIPRDNQGQQQRSSTSPTRHQPSHTSPVEDPPVSTPEFTQNDTSNQSGHIVGPAMARDAQVLERCMSSIPNTAVSYARPNPYSVYSDDTRNPVIYMKVPRQRNIAPSGNGTAGFRQFEAMEKVVEPLGSELCSVYFNNIHPPFPILDEKTVLEAYQQDGLPYALACEIYACSLLLWKTSPKISVTGRPAPDIRYMWNLTVSAMNDDFLSPNFSTVLACILDLLGRPITSITYNAVNVGRVVALSQSLGLNRNPASWGLDRRQKSLRIRTWWGILIHDQWASLSHGTPPHIHKSQWDVPLPDSDSLLVSLAGQTLPSDTRVQGGDSFIALCSLTTILGEILPLIYALEIQPLETSFRALRRHETTLNEWEESIPSWLRPTSPAFERKAAGALNLQLSFLAVKLCLSRIALLEMHRANESAADEDKLYYRSRCRKAARAVIDFVINLAQDETDAFWLPYTAYHFTSAATLMLRCALEAETPETAQECVAHAKKLIDFLRQMKNDANWDLSDICLGQCEAVVDRLCDTHYLEMWRKNPHPHPHHSGGQHAPSERVHIHQGIGNNTSAARFPAASANTLDSEVAFQPTQAMTCESAVDSGIGAETTYAEHGHGHEHTNPPGQGFLQTFMAFGSMPGSSMMAEYPAFPDLWQMPFSDEYSYRGV